MTSKHEKKTLSPKDAAALLEWLGIKASADDRVQFAAVRAADGSITMDVLVGRLVK